MAGQPVAVGVDSFDPFARVLELLRSQLDYFSTIIHETCYSHSVYRLLAPDGSKTNTFFLVNGPEAVEVQKKYFTYYVRNLKPETFFTFKMASDQCRELAARAGITFDEITSILGKLAAFHDILQHFHILGPLSTASRSRESYPLASVVMHMVLDYQPLHFKLDEYASYVRGKGLIPSKDDPEKAGGTQPAGNVKRDTKTEDRDKWIYEKCCEGIEHDLVVAELKRIGAGRGWRIFSTKNRVGQIGKEYAKRWGLEPPPPRRNL